MENVLARQEIPVTAAELLAWIEASPPAWADTTIRSLDDDIPPPAFRLVKHGRLGAVDISRIVGQENHYAGKTWRDALLEDGTHQMTNALKELTNHGADYFFSDQVKAHWYVCSWDGESWYTEGGGNHRTVLGRFLEAFLASRGTPLPPIRQVRVAHIEVDFEAWRLYQELQAYLVANMPHFTLSLLSDITSRWEEGSYFEHYTGHVCVHDARLGRTAIRTLDLSAFKRFAEYCLYPSWQDKAFRRTEGLRRFLLGQKTLYPADNNPGL